MNKKFLVTAAAGATGRKVTRLLLEQGHDVRAFVHRMDEQSVMLAKSGAELFVGDLLDFKAVSSALEGIDGAYFCYPIQPGLIDATNYFAEAARQAGVNSIVNMSQINALPEAVSHASRSHWISQGIFDRSGISVTHIRPTFFAEWYLDLAHTIRAGVLRLPLFAEGRHAPVAAEDMAQVIAKILEKPAAHAAQSYELVGPKEYNQTEIATTIGKVIGRPVIFEEVLASVYVSDVVKGGVYSKNAPPSDQAYALVDFLVQHLEAAKLQHREGLLGGTNNIIATIGGVEPQGLEEFIEKHIGAFQTSNLLV